jgi:tetratricopeptide (TPR) repeat protein
MVNELFMLLPVLPVVAVVWWTGRRGERGGQTTKLPKDEWLAQPAEWAFVGLMLAGNLIYIFCFDAVIGMARDWDLFAMFVVALVPWTLMSLGRYNRATGAGGSGAVGWVVPSLLLVAVLGVAWFGINASRWRTAERFEDILEYDKRHGSYASENLAIFYHDNNRLDRAITVIEKTYYTWRNPRHAVRVALYLQEAGREKEGIDLMYQVLENHPGYDKALFRLVILLERTGRWDEMVPVATEGVKYFPRMPVYHFYLGEALIREGRTDEGLEVFRACLELKPPVAVRRHINAALEKYGNGASEGDTRDEQPGEPQ